MPPPKPTEPSPGPPRPPEPAPPNAPEPVHPPDPKGQIPFAAKDATGPTEEEATKKRFLNKEATEISKRASDLGRVLAFLKRSGH
jgi:hypothetical protein